MRREREQQLLGRRLVPFSRWRRRRLEQRVERDQQQLLRAPVWVALGAALEQPRHLERRLDAAAGGASVAIVAAARACCLEAAEGREQAALGLLL